MFRRKLLHPSSDLTRGNMFRRIENRFLPSCTALYIYIYQRSSPPRCRASQKKTEQISCKSQSKKEILQLIAVPINENNACLYETKVSYKTTDQNGTEAANIFRCGIKLIYIYTYYFQSEHNSIIVVYNMYLLIQHTGD